jgi:succinate dehydrogenase / fumarate reductase iron-sulfur subunit
MTAAAQRITIRVQRRAGPDAAAEWQNFLVERDEAITVADALDVINREPRTVQGESVPPIAWASGCTFPTCGGCAMRIGGRALLACKTRLDAVADRRGVVTLEPLAKFPLRRDLWVDLGRMRSDFERMRAVVDAVPNAATIVLRSALGRCTSCAICLDACPEVRAGAAFVGPAAIAAAYDANLVEPSSERIAMLMLKGGIDDCGQAQNCLAACPEGVPLDEALAGSFRDATRAFLRRLWPRRVTR